MNVNWPDVVAVLTIIAVIWAAGKYFGKNETESNRVEKRLTNLEVWKDNLIPSLKIEFADRELTKQAIENLGEKINSMNNMITDIHKMLLGKRHSDNKY